MNEQLKLETALRQQQKLTPLQVQFVRMLEMTTPEVEDAVRRAVDEMPALEAKDEDSTDEPTASVTAVGQDYDDSIPTYKLRANNYSPDQSHFDATAVAPERDETLMEALADQLSLTELTDDQRLIAVNIIGNIDQNGYMTRDLQSIADDIATRTSLGDVTYEDVKRVWEEIRTLDPAGVGAVDLRDCLLLQLRRLPESEAVDTAIEIVSHYFDLFSKMHYDRIMAAMEISSSKLKDSMAVIKRLNPKPGSVYASGSNDEGAAGHVVPDFVVDVDGDMLTLSMSTRLPELSIEQTFAEDTPITPAIPRQGRDNASMFIKSKRDEAQTFIKVLSMRQQTLYRVMQAILKLQREFFITGDESLIKPMILRDIKDLTGYGLSVISRATAGKYVATPHGTYSLKWLFNERPKEDNDTSTHQLYAVMRGLIDNENKSRPLSDQRIMELMRNRGYDIARRTVAKYRENLGYPVARLRRKI